MRGLWARLERVEKAMDRAENTIQVGDVVQAKAGSPKMTVVGRSEKGNARSPFVCGWFVIGPNHQYTGEYREAEFEADALRKSAA